MVSPRETRDSDPACRRCSGNPGRISKELCATDQFSEVCFWDVSSEECIIWLEDSASGVVLGVWSIVPAKICSGAAVTGPL